MKKLLIGLIPLAAIIVLIADGERAGRTAADRILSPDIDAMLAQVANKMNERLPMMVDEQTRLDSTVGGPGRTFTYIYTLPSYASADIDVENLHGVIVNTIRQQECAIPEMRKLFKKGVTANFIYRGNDGIEITRTAVTPADCGIDS